MCVTIQIDLNSWNGKRYTLKFFECIWKTTKIHENGQNQQTSEIKIPIAKSIKRTVIIIRKLN